MLPAEKRKERLVALVIAAAVALNYPLLYLFSGEWLLFGIPVLYLYLFTMWAIIIGVVALITERFPIDDREHHGQEPYSEN